MYKFLKFTALIITSTAFSAGAQAASWTQTGQGDLSGDRLAPSFLQLALGSNSVTNNFGGIDLDYLTVNVPVDTQLTALEYTGGLLGGARSFIGVQAGSIMTVLPTTNSAADLLGWSHFIDAVGTNFLPEMGTGFGAIGFTGALAAGTYTFWIQDTSFEPDLSYAFNFQLSAAPVPEPETYAMLLAGLALISATTRKKRA